MRTTLISAVSFDLVCDCPAFAQTSAGFERVVTDSGGALVPSAEIVGTRFDAVTTRLIQPNPLSDSRSGGPVTSVDESVEGDSVKRLWFWGRP
jgi:hypothetical protein